MAGAAIASVSSMALEPRDLLLYNWGSVSLKPQLSVSETYNDNIFYGDDEIVPKESDFVTIISPGLVLQLGSQDFNYLSFSYFYDQLLYVDHSDLNVGQHRFGISSQIEKRRFTLTGRDNIEFLSTPLGGGIAVRATQVDRWIFNDEYRLAYDFSEKTQPYVEISHSTIDFEEGIALYDSQTLIGTLGFAYQLFSRSALFGEFYFGQTDHEANADALAAYPKATFYGGFLGARGNFTEQLSGTVKAGYEQREYDSGASPGGLPVVEVSLTEQFTEKTIATVSYSRRQRESVQVARTAFVSQIISAGLLQHIGNEGRFRANLKASYHMADYEPSPAYNPDREDRIFNAGLSLTYDFKLWMRGFVSYDFENLDSTVNNVVDYDQHRVTAGLTLGY